jgi:glycosyltransferase involved in cell wall biosynthesis
MAVRILHAHSTFSLGGKEARAVRLMNAWGDAAEHTILSGMPDQLGARMAIAPGLKVDFPADAPPLTGRPGLARLFRLARFMRGFDLVLTYNWGAFDAVMAKYLFRGPPLVHHEDGFNEDEAEGLKPSRNLYRRLGLSGAYRLVVPSRRLEEIARTEWAQPADRVARIGNGIPLAPFEMPPAAGVIPGLTRGEGELLIGTVAGLRKVKNLPRLVRAFAGAELPRARLVIVGEGPEREAILAEGRAARDRGPRSSARVFARSRALHGPVRHLRLVFGQRAVPDLPGRGDGGRAAGRLHGSGRHRDDGLGGEPRPHRRGRSRPHAGVAATGDRPGASRAHRRCEPGEGTRGL